MNNCEDIQVLENRVCIAESLGLCKGCEDEFFKGLEKDGFSGLRINENGIKPFGKLNKEVLKDE